MTDIATIMRTSPVIPVLVIDDASTARATAEALVRGGLRVLEVTFRTDAALDAIAEMKKVDGAIVGAGTVNTPVDVAAARKAGVEFIVSPGLTGAVAEAVMNAGIPFLPGVATSSDIMRGLALGLTHFKFFPATALGGIPALKALAGPFGQARFCPTGGISPQTAPDWLAQPNVLTVGGSWVTPRGADPVEIEERARAAADLRV